MWLWTKFLNLIEYVERIKQFLGHINLDPCSNEYSVVKADVEYRLPKDGLLESWDFPTIYVNPPYGREKNGTSIKHWLQRCSLANLDHGSQVIA